MTDPAHPARARGAAHVPDLTQIVAGIGADLAAIHGPASQLSITMRWTPQGWGVTLAIGGQRYTARHSDARTAVTTAIGTFLASLPDPDPADTQPAPGR
jgi:hypothetical protein